MKRIARIIFGSVLFTIILTLTLGALYEYREIVYLPFLKPMWDAGGQYFEEAWKVASGIFAAIVEKIAWFASVANRMSEVVITTLREKGYLQWADAYNLHLDPVVGGTFLLITWFFGWIALRNRRWLAWRKQQVKIINNILGKLSVQIQNFRYDIRELTELGWKLDKYQPYLEYRDEINLLTLMINDALSNNDFQTARRAADAIKSHKEIIEGMISLQKDHADLTSAYNELSQAIVRIGDDVNFVNYLNTFLGRIANRSPLDKPVDIADLLEALKEKLDEAKVMIETKDMQGLTEAKRMVNFLRIKYKFIKFGLSQNLLQKEIANQIMTVRTDADRKLKSMRDERRREMLLSLLDALQKAEETLYEAVANKNYSHFPIYFDQLQRAIVLISTLPANMAKPRLAVVKK